MSALHFVNESTIQKGDQVLVYGASGRPLFDIKATGGIFYIFPYYIS